MQMMFVSASASLISQRSSCHPPCATGTKIYARPVALTGKKVGILPTTAVTAATSAAYVALPASATAPALAPPPLPWGGVYAATSGPDAQGYVHV